jgi:hypothetical protein
MDLAAAIALTAFGEAAWALTPAVTLGLLVTAAVGGFALDLAGSLGAFGGPGDDEFPQFPEIDAAEAQSIADVELQAAQRRGDQRRSILAGGLGDDDPIVGFPTVLGANVAQPPQQDATLLGG